MPNTIRIDVKNEKNINRKTIIDIMIKDLRIESKFISYVSTPYSSKSWLVSFKEEYDIEKIVGVNVTINEEVVEIKDYNKPKKMLMYNTYKLLWLPHGTDLTNIENYVIDLIGPVGEIRVPKIYEEFYIDRDAPDKKKTEIKTGNVILTISYLEDINIKDIRGIHQYFKKTMRIVQFGDEMKCFGCNELGHIKSKCPYTDHTCETCGKKGHRTCSYASRVNSSENANLPQHEGDNEFGEMQQRESSSQINTIVDVVYSIEKENDRNFMYENPENKLGKTGNTKRTMENTSLNTTASSPTEQNNKKNKTDELDSSKSSKSSSNNESMESDGEDEKGENEKENDGVNGNDKWENGENGENGQDGNNEHEAKK